MTIALTGASGYLGSHVRAALGDASITRVPRDLVAAPPSWPTPPMVLVHAAGIMTADTRAVLDSARMAANLLTGLPDATRRLVLVSSAYVYAPSSVPATEETPPAPIEPYGHAKLMVEELFRGFARATNRELVVLRPCAIFGPNDPHVKAVSRFVGDAQKGQAPTLKGAVGSPRDYIHVDDAARAVVLAATGTVTGTFNVCTGEAWSALQLAALIGELRPALRVDTSQPTDAVGYRFDPAHAEKVLGFRARITLRDAVASMLES